MTAPITIDRAMRDRALFGGALGDLTWWLTWLVVLKAAFGLGLDRGDLELWHRVAGQREPPLRRVRELWCSIGRRGGKSRIAALIGVFLACFTRPRLAPGEIGMVLILAPSQAQAGVVFGYCKAFLEASPVLRGEIASTTATEIRLRSGIVIGVHANSFRSTRGRTLLACVFDECSFWRDEGSAQPDIETYRAILPSLATTAGMLVAISSPYRKAGLLYQKHRDFHGVGNDDILVVEGATSTFNPTLDAAEIERQRQADPTGARSEWDAEFRADLSSYLDDATIKAAIDHDRPLELPPRAGVFYRAYADPAGGVGADAYTIAIAHREKGGRIVLDLVRGTRGRYDPVEITRAYADILKGYRIRTVRGDRYAAEWVKGAWAKAGVHYVTSELAKSQIYLEALPVFTRGLASLPNHPTLSRELRLLERATHRSGRDTVDHPKAGHDDHINAVAGAIDAVTRALGLDYSAWSDNRETDPDVARMAAAVASNEREWGRHRRGAGTPWDVQEMIERADRERAAAAAVAAARVQPSPVEALAAWAREGQRAGP
jgi:hypothetical protein